MSDYSQFPLISAGVRRSAMKAGAKDPRSLVANVQGYDPTYQADQVQFYNDRAAEAGNLVPMADAIAGSSQDFASRSRIQTDYSQFVVNRFLSALPVLLIPQNPNRSNYYVINLGEFPIFMTFGPPNAGLLGFPIQPGATFSEKNGITSIDDIYIGIFFDDALEHVFALGYEGIPPVGVN